MWLGLVRLPPLHALNVCANLQLQGWFPAAPWTEKLGTVSGQGVSRAGGHGQAQRPSSLRPLLTGTERCLSGALIMLLPSSCPSCPRTTSLACPTPYPWTGPFKSQSPLVVSGYTLSTARPASLQVLSGELGEKQAWKEWKQVLSKVS